MGSASKTSAAKVDPSETIPASSSEQPKARGLPLAVPLEYRDLFARLYDRDHMCAVFAQVLPALAEREIRVLRCRAKPGRSEKAFVKGMLELVYTLSIEVEGEGEREYVLLGISPVQPGFPGPELEERARGLRGHPAVAPFVRLVAHVPELQLGLFVYPMDPALPGLAAITGSEGPRLLAALLPECRTGSKVECIECELVHYKPFNRAVLKVRAQLTSPDGTAGERVVYAKTFYNDRGAVQFRDLASLWSVAETCAFLRVPEPLGYMAEHRLLVMSEAPGERHLSEWIRCLRKGESLPVSLEEVERCLRVSVKALLELQDSGLRPEERYTYADELAHLRKDRDHLDGEVQARYPELLSRLDALLSRLEALAPLEEMLVPAHGEYRHQQLVGDERFLTLIDWDSFCLADPALDAARFISRIVADTLGAGAGSAELERLAGTFRREFLALRPELAHQLELYEGLHLTKQFLRSFGQTSRGEDKLAHIGLLAHAAESLLERVEHERQRATGHSQR